MKLLSVIENVPEDQLVDFLCKKDHQEDPLCLSIFSVCSDNQFLARYIEVIGKMKPEFRMQIFAQHDTEHTNSFGCTVALFGADDPIILQACLVALDDLSDVQLMEILVQKNQCGYTMGIYLMMDFQSAEVINRFFSIISEKLSADQLVQVLNMQQYQGWTMGMILARYSQRSEVFNKFFTDILGKLSAEQLVQVLNMQQSEDFTMNMHIARYCKSPEVFNKFFTDILGKLSSDQLVQVLNTQEKDGWTMGMFLARNSHDYDVFVAYRKLLQMMPADKLLQNLQLTNRSNRTFKNAFRGETGRRMRQLFQEMFRDANL
jgi:hypothetical protein